MTKRTITALFLAAVVAGVASFVVAIAASLGAIANGAVTLGGPQLVTFDGREVAGLLAWLTAAAAIGAAGSVATIVSWVAALRLTFALADRTWFYGLLVLGLCSLGWVAMAAYVVAGPDAPTSVGSSGRATRARAGADS